jgi:hypothetical protein
VGVVYQCEEDGEIAGVNPLRGLCGLALGSRSDPLFVVAPVFGSG